MHKIITVWRTLCLFTLVVFAVAGCAKVDNECRVDGAVSTAAANEPMPVKLYRGVNLSSWWEDDRSRAPQAEDFRRLHELGFDFVRLPVSTSHFETSDDKGRTQRLHELRCDIVALLNQNFKVVLDLHVGTVDDDTDDHMTPEQMTAGITNFWRLLQPMLADLPPQRLMISIYNEPHMDDEVWWKLQGKLLPVLRGMYPRNTLVVTTSPASGWWELERFKPYKDPNLIYDVHFYEPLIFTHNGAEWLESGSEHHTSETVAYPSAKTEINSHTSDAVHTYAQEKWDRVALASLIQRFAVWKKVNRVEVACLEFGVYRNHVDDESRLTWLRDVRTELERQDIPWALWEYRGPFGLVTNWGSFDESMADALGLRHSGAP